jgi:hypothetical protein
MRPLFLFWRPTSSRSHAVQTGILRPGQDGQIRTAAASLVRVDVVDDHRGKDTRTRSTTQHEAGGSAAVCCAVCGNERYRARLVSRR